MRKRDFKTDGVRGPVVRHLPRKTRITIRVDTDVLEFFRGDVERAGGGNYQSLINDALRRAMEGRSSDNLEAVLRRVLGELLPQRPPARRASKAVKRGSRSR